MQSSCTEIRNYYFFIKLFNFYFYYEISIINIYLEMNSGLGLQIKVIDAINSKSNKKMLYCNSKLSFCYLLSTFYVQNKIMLEEKEI